MRFSVNDYAIFLYFSDDFIIFSPKEKDIEIEGMVCLTQHVVEVESKLKIF